MKEYITKKFDTFLKEEGIERNCLKGVVGDILAGNTVSLGRKLYKTRMRAPGRGKSGGYRTIAFFQVQERIVFLVLFAKNERDNITRYELKALKLYADELDKLNEKEIQALIRNGSFIELNF